MGYVRDIGINRNGIWWVICGYLSFKEGMNVNYD